MVAQHYRWDFIGLSTDTKPTPETSEKVVNGSTFYCSDESKLYVFCDGTWYERKPLGGGGGTSYTAGEGIDIENNTISVDTNTIQSKLTAGDNITISDGTIAATDTTYTAGTNVSISDANVISATDTTYTAGTNVSISDANVISATDTTYSNFIGTNGSSAGSAGLVPAPATTDSGKFLKADGTWDTAGGSSVTVVQSTGTSTSSVMSQNATSSMVFADPSTKKQVQIGANSSASGSDGCVAIGRYAKTNGNGAVAVGSGTGAALAAQATQANATAIGSGAKATANGSLALNGSASSQGAVALGIFSSAGSPGLIGIGSSNVNYGYNSTNYRLIRGLYDGEEAHDAATVGQVNATIDAINTALNISIPHIGTTT